jgi:RES domain-containing protein
LNLPTRAYEGIVYRAHHPRWAFDPLSGDGAAKFGGRFNPKGTPALYTSLSVKTAWLEAQQGFAFKAQPLTVCAYDVSSSDILDATDSSVRSSCHIDLDDLSCPWEMFASKGQRVPSWDLVVRLSANGVAGMIVPSFAPGAQEAQNLVFWDWSNDAPHKVIVIDDQARLPKDQSSWV